MNGRKRIWSALLHYPVLDKEGGVVTTSVTNMDVHDLARTGRTFGLAAVFIVTPIDIHREMVRRVASLWQDPKYGKRTPSRQEALKLIRVAVDIEEVVALIGAEAGEPPRVVGTTARFVDGAVPYDELRSLIEMEPEPPWLFIFGTGWGLAPEAMKRCHFVLKPIEGVDGYAHLSVRSAAAIILDRLLGKR